MLLDSPERLFLVVLVYLLSWREIIQWQLLHHQIYDKILCAGKSRQIRVYGRYHMELLATACAIHHPHLLIIEGLRGRDYGVTAEHVITILCHARHSELLIADLAILPIFKERNQLLLMITYE